MRGAASAIIGFLLGAMVGLVGYVTVFIFSDVISDAGKRLDVDEANIFLGTLLACAVLGSIVSTLLAFIRSRREKARSGALLPPAEGEVCPPAPEP